MTVMMKLMQKFIYEHIQVNILADALKDEKPENTTQRGRPHQSQQYTSQRFSQRSVSRKESQKIYSQANAADLLKHSQNLTHRSKSVGKSGNVELVAHSQRSRSVAAKKPAKESSKSSGSTPWSSSSDEGEVINTRVRLLRKKNQVVENSRHVEKSPGKSGMSMTEVEEEKKQTMKSKEEEKVPKMPEANVQSSQDRFWWSLDEKFPQRPAANRIHDIDSYDKYLRGKRWVVYSDGYQMLKDDNAVFFIKVYGQEEEQFRFYPLTFFEHMTKAHREQLQEIFTTLGKDDYDRWMAAHKRYLKASSLSGSLVLHHEARGSTHLSGRYAYDWKRFEYNKLYEPEKLFTAHPFFRGGLCQEYNDCVIYSINTLLGWPFFKDREQVVRFMSYKKKSPQDAKRQKKTSGVQLDVFDSGFAVHDGKVLSLQQQKDWQYKGPASTTTIFNYLKKTDSCVAVYLSLNQIQHAVTFLRYKGKLYCCDSASESDDMAVADEAFLKDWIAGKDHISLYGLHMEAASDEDLKKVEAHASYAMTGRFVWEERGRSAGRPRGSKGKGNVTFRKRSAKRETKQAEGKEKTRK